MIDKLCPKVPAIHGATGQHNYLGMPFQLCNCEVGEGRRVVKNSFLPAL